MNDHLILILNPFNSSIEIQLISTINTLQSVNYISFDSLDPKIDPNQKPPSLIVVLLDNCIAANIESSQLENLNKYLPQVSILCFVKTKNTECINCLKCQKFSWNFIHTPIFPEEILFILQRHINDKQRMSHLDIEFSLKRHSILGLLKGNSSATTNIKNKILKIAPLDITILIQGETGTGKELCSKLLHSLSKQSKGPLVSVNCGAIPNELFENELFGHKKGAYTHADATEKGIIHSAQHGTLFLDEIEALPKSSQVKLLRFLEEKEYRPLGQTTFVKSDVRIMVASNYNLKLLVEEGSFRSDLFYRLSIVNLILLPLRERLDDIPILAKHFVEKFSKLYSKKIIGIRPQAMMSLVSHSWPGNIRELENMIQEAVIFNYNGWVEAENLNFTKYIGKENKITKSFQEAKKQHIKYFEENYLKTVLKVFNGNISKASEFAKKDRREFYRLIKKHKIEPTNYRFVKQ